MLAGVERGRELVASGLSPPEKMADFHSLTAYWDVQRQLIDRRGRCEAGCQQDVPMYVARGVELCPHTMWTCPQRRFSRLVAFFQEARRMAEGELAVIDGPIVPQSDLQQMIAIDKTSRACAQQLLEAGANEAVKALITAKAIGHLSALLSDKVMTDIMQLQNSILGFRTDKPDGYNREAVRNCVTIALMRGLRITGNEWNIIAGNLYVTKEGYERLLHELPGFANFKLQVSVPKMVGEGALVAAKAQWMYQGQKQSMDWQETKEGDYRIAVKVNKGMGSDAILGKARSKALRQVYALLTGSEFESVGDAEEGTVEAA